MRNPCQQSTMQCLRWLTGQRLSSTHRQELTLAYSLHAQQAPARAASDTSTRCRTTAARCHSNEDYFLPAPEARPAYPVIGAGYSASIRPSALAPATPAARNTASHGTATPASAPHHQQCSSRSSPADGRRAARGVATYAAAGTQEPGTDAGDVARLLRLLRDTPHHRCAVHHD